MAESDVASSAGSESDDLSCYGSDCSGDPEWFFTAGADCPRCRRRLPCNREQFRVRALRKWTAQDHLGCNICSAIIQATSSLYERLDKGQSPLSFVRDPLSSSGIRVVNDKSTFATLVKVSAACPDEDLKKVLGTMNKSSPNLAGTLDTCRKWLNGCISDHPDHCPQNDTYVPHRLLDLSRLKPTGHVFLVERNPGHFQSAMTEYACLSHCWGFSQPVQTTTSNIQSYIQVGLTFQELPSTFRDAIQVTQHMDVRYLWIDSICIIQEGDNRMDWSTQAAEMSRIYGCSRFTIAATAASGCEDGFLKGLAQKHPFAKSDYGSDPGQNIIAVACRQHHHWRAGDSSMFALRDRLPLQTRAWTLQEHLLSPRTLSFGVDEVVWECRSHMDCECGEIIVDAGAKLLDRPETEGEKVQFWQSISAPEPDGNFTESWSSMIKAYANRRLTNQEDRRIALQGIVDVVEQKYGLDYMYGHWGYNLVVTLSWCASAESCAVPKVWRAPTWSWMSLEHKESAFHPGDLAREGSFGEHQTFIAEYMCMKGLHRLNTPGLISWDKYPDGTLWLSTWVCDGFLQPVMDESDDELRLFIPALSCLEPDADYTEIHTDSSIDREIEIRCVILAHIKSMVYYLICRSRNFDGPLARIGSGASRDWGFKAGRKFQLADECVKETVAIW